MSVLVSIPQGNPFLGDRNIERHTPEPTTESKYLSNLIWNWNVSFKSFISALRYIKCVGSLIGIALNL